MVLRKPYAFLIKNFKLIHVLLTILMGCMFKKMRDIVEYLDEYIAVMFICFNVWVANKIAFHFTFSTNTTNSAHI